MAKKLTKAQRRVLRAHAHAENDLACGIGIGLPGRRYRSEIEIFRKLADRGYFGPAWKFRGWWAWWLNAKGWAASGVVREFQLEE